MVGFIVLTVLKEGLNSVLSPHISGSLLPATPVPGNLLLLESMGTHMVYTLHNTHLNKNVFKNLRENHILYLTHFVSVTWL